jgi:hypothetical protein
MLNDESMTNAQMTQALAHPLRLGTWSFLIRASDILSSIGFGDHRKTGASGANA